MAIVAHYVPACAPSPGNAPAQLELIALGDFDRSNDSVSILPSNAAQQSVSLPAGTRAAELNTLGDRGYWGAGALGTHNELSILLWPKNQSCQLARALAGGVSPNAEAGLLGASARLGRLLMVRPRPGTEAAGLSIDLSNATVSMVPAAQGLTLARANASISELGDQFLIAGGIDPDTQRTHQTAEIFDPVSASFDPVLLTLGSARARHAALSLPSGSSMLIGGESEGGAALRSVEIVSPDASRSSRLLTLLATPRILPKALLFDRNRILVGGGYTYAAGSDGPNPGLSIREAVASVELLNIDLAEVSQEPIRLEPAALDRAFVALGPGGALAVGGCGPVQPASDCVPCADGLGCVSRDVWWIDPQGTPHELEPLPPELSAAQPWLVPGAEGAPWLIADGRLGQFDPWRARFNQVEGTALGAASVSLSEPVAVGPGLFVWLQADTEAIEVAGLYHSQRGPFSQDVAPLLVGSGRGIVPHLPPMSSEAAAEVTLQYSVAAGLRLAGSAAVASVADTDYADFTLELSLASGPPPLLKLVSAGSSLDSSASFGGLECPWPDFDAPGGEGVTGPMRLRVQRTADRVWLELANEGSDLLAPPEPCQRSLPERVAVQLVGTPAGTTQITRVEIRRSVEPTAN